VQQPICARPPLQVEEGGRSSKCLCAWNRSLRSCFCGEKTSLLYEAHLFCEVESGGTGACVIEYDQTVVIRCGT